jgi:hypothetical protein
MGLMMLLAGIIGVVALVLLSLQPNENIFTPNAPKISFTSLLTGIGLNTLLLLAVVHVFLSPNIEDDPYYAMVFLFSLMLFVILCVISVVVKVLYDYVVFPFFRKAGQSLPLQYAITTIKRLTVGGLLVFLLLTLRQIGVNEHQSITYQEQRDQATLKLFEQVLNISLHHDARIISYDFMYAADGYDGYSLEIEGNEELIHKLSRTHQIVEEPGHLTFEEPYGRGDLRVSCVQQDASTYSCSLRLSGSSGR